MKVFKFGGASLKNADGFRNVASIILSHANQAILIVVSAMGKTTDMLERLLALPSDDPSFLRTLEDVKSIHLNTIEALFTNPNPIRLRVAPLLASLENQAKQKVDTDLGYDQLVSTGELLSSLILHHYLATQTNTSEWIDAGDYICTDRTFREARVNWAKTEERMYRLRDVLENNLVVTQGFIGRTDDGMTTTLGREGSDFSAAIFGACLGAESVTIWKDVAGVMSADPRRFPHAVVFEELPFREAAEMTYYGASVIHPKTIKPLANLGIPLLVKNFEDPSLPGTRIHECTVKNLPPLIVHKENQCLISCKVTDYTFISEAQLSTIFNTLLELNVRINVMQNSAISFSFCIDFRERKVTPLIERLQRNFEVSYNTGLTLITIKNYDRTTSETYRQMRGVLLEQSSRSTLQVLVKDA